MAASKLKNIMKRFGEDMGRLRFGGSVAYTYNPLDYAWAGHEAFLDKFFGGGRSPPGVGEDGDDGGDDDRVMSTIKREVKTEEDAGAGEEQADQAAAVHHAEHGRLPPTLLLSMNPGPYGMTQSGVPFGAPTIVKEWMKIDLGPDAIRPPPIMCPSRPVFGFSSSPLSSSTKQESEEANDGKKRKRTKAKKLPSLRQEVSGKRIYVDWAMNTWSSPEDFFQEFYIHPYCPMQFLEASGTNITPDKLSRQERAEVYAVCDQYLREVIQCLRPKRIINIGNFADERLRDALNRWKNELDDNEDPDIGNLLETIVIGKIPHPSPRSPLARIMWGNGGTEINKLLAKFGVEIPRAISQSITADVPADDDEVKPARPVRKKAKREVRDKTSKGLSTRRKRRG